MRHQFFLDLFTPFSKGPLKYFNVIFSLKNCYLSLIGFCGWYWHKACLFRWNAIKTEKAKFSKQYPYLVPRSYANSCRKPPAFSSSSIHLKTAANVKCQVSAQWGRKINKMLRLRFSEKAKKSPSEFWHYLVKSKVKTNLETLSNSVPFSEYVPYAGHYKPRILSFKKLQQFL